MSATAVGGGRREGVTVTGWCHCGAVGPGGGGGARDPTAGAGRLTMVFVSSLVTRHPLFLSLLLFLFFFFASHSSLAGCFEICRILAATFAVGVLNQCK